MQWSHTHERFEALNLNNKKSKPNDMKHMCKVLPFHPPRALFNNIAIHQYILLFHFITKQQSYFQLYAHTKIRRASMCMHITGWEKEFRFLFPVILPFYYVCTSLHCLAAFFSCFTDITYIFLQQNFYDYIIMEVGPDQVGILYPFRI